MKKLLLCLSLFVGFATLNAQNIYNYGFTTGTAGLTTDGWQRTNQSVPATTVLWSVPTAAPTATFAGGAQSLPAISFALVNFTSVGTLTTTGSTGAGPISNWLISPIISVKNGDVVTFYSRLGQNASSTTTEYPDRLQLRMSTDGALTTNPSAGSTDIGSFSALLVDINPTLVVGVYPRIWTQYSYIVTGLPTPTDVKFGFRYFVTDGGQDGANSNIIGIDTFSVDVPEACAPPTALTAAMTTTTGSTISWTAPATSPANGYEYYYSTTNTAPIATTVANGSTAAGVTTKMLTGLNANSVYYAWVRSACSATEKSSWSAIPATFNTTLPPNCAGLTAPVDLATNVVVAYQNDAATVTTRDNSFELTWTAPTAGGAVTGYNIYLGATAASLVLLNPTPFVGTLVNITGVTHNTTYYWRIDAVNAGGAAIGCAVRSFTTGPVPVGCMNGQLYPAASYTPATCNGTTVNQINADAYAGEYANVVVTAGQNYQFRSSVATDFLSISTDSGITAAAGGTTPLTWTATAAGTVRFYINLVNCGTAAVNRTRSVICGPSLVTDTFSSTNFQSFPNPVKDILNLSYDKNITAVSVINLLGQEVLSLKNDNQELKIDMASLTAGVYMVKINADNEVKTIKVIKE